MVIIVIWYLVYYIQFRTTSEEPIILPPIPNVERILLLGTEFSICNDGAGMKGLGDTIKGIKYDLTYLRDYVDTNGLCEDNPGLLYNNSYNTWQQYTTADQESAAYLISNTLTISELENFYLSNWTELPQEASAGSRGFFRTFGPSSSSSSQ